MKTHQNPAFEEFLTESGFAVRVISGCRVWSQSDSFGEVAGSALASAPSHLTLLQQSRLSAVLSQYVFTNSASTTTTTLTPSSSGSSIPPLMDSSSVEWSPPQQVFSSTSASGKQTSESDSGQDSCVSESASRYSFYYFPIFLSQLGSEIDARPSSIKDLCSDGHFSVKSHLREARQVSLPNSASSSISTI